MKTWRRCKLKYYWKYIQNYDEGSSIGQVKGSIGHNALGEWYRSYDREKALQVASDTLQKYEQDAGTEYQEEWELLELVLSRYFDWSEQNDVFEKTVGIEQRFDMKIDGIPITGYIDGIVTVNGVNWLLEHKFLKQARTKGLPLDPQVSIYLLAARTAGYNPRGVLYNVIRMAKGGVAEREPVIRIPLYRNAEGMNQIAAELGIQLREMRDFHENGGAIYRNCIDDCSWDCRFFSVCLSINDNGDADSVLATFSKKNEFGRSEEPDEYEGE